jgi:PAS domain S-box-containing protein
VARRATGRVRSLRQVVRAAHISGGWPGLFESAFKRSQNAMALTDDERRLVQVNAALAQLLGYRPSQLVGRHTYEFVVGGPLLSREQWSRAIERGEVTGDAEVRRANGDTIRVQFGIHAQVVNGRRVVLFVALAASRWGRHYRREGSDATGQLSAREREVIGMVAHGATSPEIASELHITNNTVRKHVNSAMRKLGARSRAHLVAKVLADSPAQG